VTKDAKIKKHSRLRKAGKIAAYFFGGIGVLMLIGASIEAIASASDSKNYPPLGKLVQVDGHNMHIYCTGTGSPTVVLDAGSGEGSASWSDIQGNVSKVTRVCSYDRMGMAWSDVGDKPRTYGRITEELHSLLSAAGEKGPYVLVGHSFGSFTARIFATEYANETVGVVLVDPTSENGLSSHAGLAGTERALAFLAKLGLFRIGGSGLASSLDDAVLPRAEANNVPIVYGAKSENTAADEFDVIGDTGAQVKETFHKGALGNKPLVVISAINEMSKQMGNMEFHKSLATLSTNGTVVSAEGPHTIQWANPTLVIDSITSVVNSSK
jgi:pimeloyl-ACP methyl ester carboxylesterase